MSDAIREVLETDALAIRGPASVGCLMLDSLCCLSCIYMVPEVAVSSLKKWGETTGHYAVIQGRVRIRSRLREATPGNPAGTARPY